MTNNDYENLKQRLLASAILFEVSESELEYFIKKIKAATGDLEANLDATQEDWRRQKLGVVHECFTSIIQALLRTQSTLQSRRLEQKDIIKQFINSSVMRD